MKALVLGTQHMQGTSDKGKGSPYDIRRAHIVMPNDGWKTQHGESRAYGFMAVEQNISKECFLSLQKVPFPAYVEFQVDHQPGRNGLELLLTDVISHKPLAPSA